MIERSILVEHVRCNHHARCLNVEAQADACCCGNECVQLERQWLTHLLLDKGEQLGSDCCVELGDGSDAVLVIRAMPQG